MNLEQAKEAISKKQDQIDLIQAELTEKSEELEGKWQRYSQCLVANAGKERKAASLDIQKRGVIEAQAEFEALQGAREILQGEFDELEKEKCHSELFDSFGQSYNCAMTECGETHKRIMGLLKSLKRDLNEFNVGVLSLIKNQEQARGSFGVLYEKVDPALSLGAFLNGEILETEQSDKESVAQKTREEVMQISNVPYEKIEVEFVAFRDSMGMLDQWRRFVAAKDIIRNRAAFVYTPKGKPAISIDAETRRAGSQMAMPDQEIRRRILQNPERYDDETKRKYGIGTRPTI